MSDTPRSSGSVALIHLWALRACSAPPQAPGTKLLPCTMQTPPHGRLGSVLACLKHILLNSRALSLIPSPGISFLPDSGMASTLSSQEAPGYLNCPLPPSPQAFLLALYHLNYLIFFIALVIKYNYLFHFIHLPQSA